MRTHNHLVCLCAAALLACSPPTDNVKQEPLVTAPPLMASAWPTFQGSTLRDGARSVEPVLKPKIAWRTRVGVQGWLNSPILVADMVITSSSGAEWNAADSQDGVVALDAASGARRWFAPARADVNSISYAMGTIVAAGDEGAVWALDAATGKQLWLTTSPQGAKYYASPLMIQGLAIVADAQGNLDALDLRTGKRRWSVALREEVRNGLSSDGATIYVATTRGTINALDLGGGLRWRLVGAQDGWQLQNQLPEDRDAARPESFEPVFYAAPTIVGNLLIATYARDTTYGAPAVIAVNRVTGALVWQADSAGLQKNDSWGNVRSSPVSTQDALYWAEPYSRDVASVELTSGKLRFRSAMGACTFPQWASPAASSDLIYVPRMDGTLWAISPGYGLVDWQLYLGDEARAGLEYPDDLKARAKSEVCDWDLPGVSGLYASPALGPDGSIYQGTGDGFLYKVVDSSPPSSP